MSAGGELHGSYTGVTQLRDGGREVGVVGDASRTGQRPCGNVHACVVHASQFSRSDRAALAVACECARVCVCVEPLPVRWSCRARVVTCMYGMAWHLGGCCGGLTGGSL